MGDMASAISAEVIDRDFVAWAFKLFHVEPVQDDLDRPIHVTHYPGAYGWAGVVLVISGSPPRGTFLYDFSAKHCVAICEGKVAQAPWKAKRLEEFFQKHSIDVQKWRHE